MKCLMTIVFWVTLLSLFSPAFLAAQPVSEPQDSPPVESSTEAESDNAEGAMDEDIQLGDVIDEETLKMKEQAFRKLYNSVSLEDLKNLAELFEIPFDPEIEKEQLITLLIERLQISAVEVPDEEEEKKTITIPRARREASSLPIESGGGLNITFDKAITKTETDEKGFYKIIVFGHCYVEWGERKIWADLIVVNYRSGGDEEERARDEILDVETVDLGEDTSEEETELSPSEDTESEEPSGETGIEIGLDSTTEEESIPDESEQPTESEADSEEELSESGDASEEEAEEEGTSGGEITEIMAMGNIKYEDSSQILLGDKLFYYFASQRAILYNAVTYNQFYIRAAKAKYISQNKFVVIDAKLSSCDLEFPHYQILCGRSWFYDKNKIIITNGQYRLGDSIIIYFPLLFQSSFGTGIQTAFATEWGVGWYLHNTMEGKIFDQNYTLKVDYFQKLGLYIGLSTKIKLVDVDIGVAWSRAVRYVGDFQNRFTNYFDMDGDGELDSDSTFRYRLKLGMSLPLAGDPEEELKNLFSELGIAEETDEFGNVIEEDEEEERFDRDEEGNIIFDAYATPDEIQEELTEDFRDRMREKSESIFGKFKPNLTFNFEQTSDPYFQQQFESMHKTQFNLQDLIDTSKRSSQSLTGFQGSVPAAVRGRSLGFSSGISAGSLSVNFSGNWTWNIQRDSDNPDATNPYRPFEYYEYVPNSYDFPKISAKTSATLIENLFDMFSSEDEEEEGEPGRREGTRDEDAPRTPASGGYTPVDITDRDEEDETEDEDVDSLLLEDDDEKSMEREEKFIRQLGLSFNFGFSFSGRKQFDEFGILESDSYTTSANGGYSLPFSIGYDFIKFNASHSLSLNAKNSLHRDPTPEQKYRDEQQSTGSWSTNNSVGLNLHFLDEYEFLETDIGINYSHSFGRENEPDLYNIQSSGAIPTVDQKTNERQSYGLTVKFMKCNFSLSTSDNLQIPLKDLELLDQTDTDGRAFGIDESGKFTGQKGQRFYMEDIERKQKGAISTSFNINLFKNLSLSNSYSEERSIEGNGVFGGQSQTYSFSSSFKFPMAIELTDWLLVNTASLNMSYTHNYRDVKQSNASISLSLDFNITKEWKFSLTASAKNSMVYLYSSKLAESNGRKHVNFLADVLRSYNIFKIQDRVDALWKTGPFSINVQHSLHKWDMQFNFSFSPVNRGVATIWEPSFSLNVTLKELPSFAAPPIESEWNRRY